MSRRADIGKTGIISRKLFFSKAFIHSKWRLCQGTSLYAITEWINHWSNAYIWLDVQPSATVYPKKWSFACFCSFVTLRWLLHLKRLTIFCSTPGTSESFYGLINFIYVFYKIYLTEFSDLFIWFFKELKIESVKIWRFENLEI